MSNSTKEILAMQIAIVKKAEALTEQMGAQWRHVCALADIPVLGARVVKNESGDIAVFRNAEDEVFALRDKCPHKGGPLSQGIVFGRHVACPLHGWTIKLEDGCAIAPDEGCTNSFSVRVEDGQVFLQV